ncbi:FAD-dependent monooxygenase [Streptomyces sp. CHD11]|uniref:FAD-dependent oxidoreductase n=1 Tax=Streptomyces sp. CHD11 TaxID=2741325 RepID=UPI001BFCBDD3|nr:NAD(P)/FAD-dependent oxidoreductase [Streptomyces sp. CHD11]MBT3154589.1 FAD-dependent monooxygenase [Streptomyces sp. CHD11]
MRTTVIGGGIAGPAIALALQQIGHDVTVYEAYDVPVEEVGAHFSLAVNGLRALEKLGCLREVEAVGHPIDRMRFYSGGGRLLGDVPRLRRGTDPMRSISLQRGRLVAVLRRAALDAGARIVTGERLVGATESADNVVAEFASGRRETAELLVGADGIWSTVRGQIDSSAPRAEYAGLYGVAGISTMKGLEPGVWNLTYTRNGAFVYTSVDEQTQWWTAQIGDPVKPDLRGIDDARWLRRVSELFPEATPRAIVGAATSIVASGHLSVCDPIQKWHSGRMVLVGDAAHPVGVGHGASMCIEDALELAAALSRTPTVPAALKAYDETRRPRIDKLLKHGHNARESKRPGAVKRQINAAKMRALLPFFERVQGYLYDYEPPSLSAAGGSRSATR